MKFKFGLYFLLPFISAVVLNTSFAQDNEPDKTFSVTQEKESEKSQRIICVLILRY
jgi:thiamine transporter ThiT